MALKKKNIVTLNPSSRTDQLDSDLRYRRLIEGSPLGIQENDTNGVITFANSALGKILGYDLDEIVGKSIWDFSPKPEDAAQIKKYLAYLLAEQPEPAPFTGKFQTKDGRGMEIQVDWNYQYDEQGNLVGFSSISSDITERKIVDRKLRLKEKEIEISEEGVFTIGENGNILDVNEVICRRLGYSRDELLRMKIPDINPEYPEIKWKIFWSKLKTEKRINFESVHRRKNGEIIPVEVSGVYVEFEGDEYLCSFVRDITNRKIIEKNLRQANEELETLVDERTQDLKQSEAVKKSILNASTDSIFHFDIDGYIIDANEIGAKRFGKTTEEMAGKCIFDFMPTDVAEARRSFWSTLIATKKPVTTEDERDGVWFESVTSPHFDEDGQVIGASVIARDITGRKNAEKVLKENEIRLQHAHRIAGLGYFERDIATGVTYWSEQHRRIFGASKDVQPSYDLYIELVHPDDRENVISTNQMAAENLERFDLEYRIPLSDGSIRHIHEVGEFLFDADGKPYKKLGTIRDISEQKHFEAQLAEAKKMEALGQLTGGIAHEFNNMLMAVTGNLELLVIKLGGQEELTQLASSSLNAAFRGSKLTQQLLSYTGKQTLSPEATDVNYFLSDTVGLLQPSLGEIFELEANLADDVWPITVDQGQLQQAILNLVVNSRDAMPEGGKVTVETANVSVDEAFTGTRSFAVEAGDYIMISVSDTGTGMSPEVIEKAFDPFFTTKGMAEGTGLGMSMVYGFIRKQSGGFIDIDSEVGRGTTVRLYLPRSELIEEGPDVVEERQGGADKGKGRVLIVEDDEAVCNLVCDVLQTHGYDTIGALNGPDALAQLQQSGPIDLLLTDIVLPKGMDGIELAQRVIETSPSSKVIFMTAYSEHEILGKGLPKDGYRVLHKPMRIIELANIVAEVIAGEED